MNAVCYSHIGSRPNQEDNFLFCGRFITESEQKVFPPQGLFLRDSGQQKNVKFFAVSDGMGGHNAGENASLITVSRLAELEPTVQNCSRIEDVVLLCQNVITEINYEVCKLGNLDRNKKGLGATLVLLIFCGQECAVLNIGDSRALFFDGHEINQITKDNTEGQRMIDLNLLTSDELKTFPARKNLNRYIGIDDAGYRLVADKYVLDKNQGLFLLCSDGITDSLSKDNIADILITHTDIEMATREIVSRAVSVNKSDNATIILIQNRE